MQDILTITPQAKSKIFSLLEQRGSPCLGIRVGVKTQGGSGLSYTLDFVEEEVALDEKVALADNINVYIDSKALLFLFGIEMDYEVHDLEEGFTFTNPNEKGKCGCGESFHV